MSSAEGTGLAARLTDMQRHRCATGAFVTVAMAAQGCSAAPSSGAEVTSFLARVARRVRDLVAGRRVRAVSEGLARGAYAVVAAGLPQAFVAGRAWRARFAFEFADLVTAVGALDTGEKVVVGAVWEAASLTDREVVDADAVFEVTQ